MNKVAKRTAREIKIDSKLIKNKNLNVKIGTVENRDYPETIYIYISFWISPTDRYIKKSQDFLKRKLTMELEKVYTLGLERKLTISNYFPNEKENIYIFDIPENFNYNKKKNFISIELNLHTININHGIRIPLSNKRETKLFEEALKLSNIIGNSKVLRGDSGFIIKKKSS
jgi:hypothetical protein